MPKEKWIEEMFESLAGSIKVGFDEAREHTDGNFRLLHNQLQLLHDEIRDMRRKIDQLVQSQAGNDREIMDLEERLTRIERHLGILA